MKPLFFQQSATTIQPTEEVIFVHPIINDQQREALRSRYLLLPPDQAVEILDSPQMVEQNGRGPTQFFHNDAVWLTVPDRNHPGRVMHIEGRIGIFIRSKNHAQDRGVSAVVLDAQHYWRRALLTTVSKIDPHSSADEETLP